MVAGGRTYRLIRVNILCNAPVHGTSGGSNVTLNVCGGSGTNG